MANRTKKEKSADAQRKKIKFERILKGSMEDIWDLWTTKKGFESWWGPEGFVTNVRKLDLRPGGAFKYAMTATGLEQIEALKAAGIPLISVAGGTYTEVAPRRRLAYKTLADFIPGVAPYEVASVVEFHPGNRGIRMVMTEDAMHNEEWTKMSEMGMNSSLDRLVKLLEARHIHR